ncbi:MAG: VWA domain-containing protein [Candidatus Sulfotelmatobacter sp.]
MRTWPTFIFVLAGSLMAAGQSTAAVPVSDSASNFKIDVKLVPVHVVVRDAQGHPVGNLHKEDFQLFDQGKPQVIAQFTFEQADAHVAETTSRSGEKPAPRAAPARYTAYLFDDLHLSRNDLVQAREAADRQFASLSAATERAAVFTTSGEKGVDFTADSAKLHEIVAHLEPRGKQAATDCPAMSYYMADLIANRGDADALQIATNDSLACSYDGNVKMIKAAGQTARAIAHEKSEIGRMETGKTIRILRALVQGMSKAPGQRVVVIVSPGFFTGEDQSEGDILDLAVRSDITINTVDPRGLVTSLDVSTGRIDPQLMAYKTLSDTEESSILDELADGTGGIFFHNNNDLGEGLRRVAGSPEYSYVLGFSPKELKNDGRFHKLKVTVNSGAKLTVQARKGYYAPKKKR